MLVYLSFLQVYLLANGVDCYFRIIANDVKYIPYRLRYFREFILHFILYFILHFRVIIVIISHCIKQTAQHIFHEQRAFTRLITFLNNMVILLLMFLYDGFYRQPCKDTFPTAEQHRLPIAPHTTIAINKGMNKLKLIVENARIDEWMRLTCLNPLEEVTHQFWHSLRWWSHVQTVAITIEYAYTIITIMSCVTYQIFHHESMSLQQILFLECVQMRHKVIGFNSVLHLLYLVRRT